MDILRKKGSEKYTTQLLHTNEPIFLPGNSFRKLSAKNSKTTNDEHRKKIHKHYIKNIRKNTNINDLICTKNIIKSFIYNQLLILKSISNDTATLTQKHKNSIVKLS